MWDEMECYIRISIKSTTNFSEKDYFIFILVPCVEEFNVFVDLRYSVGIYVIYTDYKYIYIYMVMYHV